MLVNRKVMTRQYSMKDNKKNNVTQKKSWLRETPRNNFYS